MLHPDGPLYAPIWRYNVSVHSDRPRLETEIDRCTLPLHTAASVPILALSLCDRDVVLALDLVLRGVALTVEPVTCWAQGAQAPRKSRPKLINRACPPNEIAPMRFPICPH